MTKAPSLLVDLHAGHAHVGEVRRASSTSGPGDAAGSSAMRTRRSSRARRLRIQLRNGSSATSATSMITVATDARAEVADAGGRGRWPTSPTATPRSSGSARRCPGGRSSRRRGSRCRRRPATPPGSRRPGCSSPPARLRTRRSRASTRRRTGRRRRTTAMWVRSPAGCSDASRSMPIAAPSTTATSSRTDGVAVEPHRAVPPRAPAERRVVGAASTRLGCWRRRRWVRRIGLAVLRGTARLSTPSSSRGRAARAGRRPACCSGAADAGWMPAPRRGPRSMSQRGRRRARRR